MRGPEPTGVVAVFDTQAGAASAIDWLRVHGVEKRAVSVIGPRNATSREDVPPELDHGGTHLREIAAYWSEWGAALGATAGAGPTTIALIAATVGIGPLATALLPALALVAATTGVGALAAAFVGVGLHDQKAREYERAIAGGGYVVVVHTDDPVAIRTTKGELARLGARSVDAHGA